MNTTPTPTAQTPASRAINRHAIGPLEWTGTKAKPRARVYLRGPTPDGLDTRHMLSCATEPVPPDARLLASAYTMADRAARELGVDAAILCESLDLAALIRHAQTSVNVLEHFGQDSAARALRNALPPVFPRPSA